METERERKWREFPGGDSNVIKDKTHLLCRNTCFSGLEICGLSLSLSVHFPVASILFYFFFSPFPVLKSSLREADGRGFRLNFLQAGGWKIHVGFDSLRQGG